MLCTDNASPFAPRTIRGHLDKRVVDLGTGMVMMSVPPATQASHRSQDLPAMLALTKKFWALDDGRRAVMSEDFDDEFDRALSGLCELDMMMGKVRATSFAKSVSLMAAMDWFENAEGFEDGVCTTPERACLFLLNCEYQLHKLNMSTPLSYHPALPFWVKTIVKWNSRLNSNAEELRWEGPATRVSGHLKQALGFRVEYVKRILDAARPPGVPVLPPKEFLNQAWPSLPSAFRIEEYVDVLRRGGIPWMKWYNDLSSEMLIPVLQAMESWTSKDQKDLRDNSIISKPMDGKQNIAHDQGPPSPEEEPTSTALSQTHAAEQAMLSGSQTSLVTGNDPTTQGNLPTTRPSMDATSLLNLAKSSPSDVQQILTKLPLDLPSMELINTILAAEFPSLNPAVIACEYIQHGLRMLENPSATTTISSSESSVSTTSSSAAPSNSNDSSSYSPTEQHFKDPGERTRRVELLILFIKNLIRKNVVSFQDLQFDVQEIATRFAGIRKVREFRRWLETGEDVT